MFAAHPNQGRLTAIGGHDLRGRERGKGCHREVGKHRLGLVNLSTTLPLGQFDIVVRTPSLSKDRLHKTCETFLGIGNGRPRHQLSASGPTRGTKERRRGQWPFRPAAEMEEDRNAT